MTRAEKRAWRETAGGLVLRVRVTPRSSREEIGGLDETAQGSALRVKVRAAPADGEANDAVLALVARWLDLPRRNVALVSGASGRIKTLSIDGDADRIAASVQAKLTVDG